MQNLARAQCFGIGKLHDMHNFIFKSVLRSFNYQKPHVHLTYTSCAALSNVHRLVSMRLAYLSNGFPLLSANLHGIKIEYSPNGTQTGRSWLLVSFPFFRKVAFGHHLTFPLVIHISAWMTFHTLQISTVEIGSEHNI